jgi:type III secretion system low calcium response chaperone LcrH/SycD
MPKSKFSISRQLRGKLLDKSWMQQQMNSGKSVQDILGFSSDLMQELHSCTRELFEQHLYQEATDAFLFLVTLCPSRFDFWLGLGASTQRTNDYEGAIDAYEMAAICEINNPWPYFYLANCLFAIHERDSALQAIELALEYSENREEYHGLYQQALAAKSLLFKEGL